VITEKDLSDLHFALGHNVDWIGLSFVRTAEDVRALKEIIFTP
jgi:pyruvate kinase